MGAPVQKRNSKAVSPYLSVLMLLSLALSASLLTYAFIIFGLSSVNPVTYKAINIQGVSIADNQLLIYVKNTGYGSVYMNPGGDANVFVNNVDKNYIIVEADLQKELPAGRTCTIKIMDLDPSWFGKANKIKIVAAEGITVAGTYNLASNLPRTYTVKASATGPGSISPGGDIIVDEGASLSLSIKPNPGKIIVDVVVDGISQGPISNYLFENVVAYHSVTAFFGDKPVVTYKITASVIGSGEITPDGVVTVDEGATQAFKVTPEKGYNVVDVVIDDTIHLGLVDEYNFTNVIADHTITAKFVQKYYTITATAGEGGTITPSGYVAVIVGDTQSFTITPNFGYHVANILIDGKQHLGAESSHSFTNVESDHSIDVAFEADKPNTHIITVSCGQGGMIIPSGPTITVNEGANQSFDIYPDTGYHVADVIIDETQHLGAVSQYTFKNIVTDHKISASFAIEITITYKITVDAGPGGTITPQGPSITVRKGASKSFTIIPNKGYHIVDVVLDDAQHLGAVTSYEFQGVIKNHKISATFALTTHKITASVSGAGGTITPLGDVTVNDGASQMFTIVPDKAYHILDVVVDSISQGAIGTYTFTNVLTDHTISATFAPNPVITYTITASASEGGTIMPSGILTLNKGATQKFEISPNTGYHIVDVTVDGTPFGPITSYRFTNVDDDHIITASFAADTGLKHTITASACGHGSITPSGEVTVADGANQTFTITPEPGYHIKSLLVDGSPTDIVNEYTFVNVVEGHTILVTFEINTPTSYKLTVNIVGQGSVTLDPDQKTYLSGTGVELTAVPNECWEFEGWSQDLTGTKNPISITMNSEKAVTATFIQAPKKASIIWLCTRPALNLGVTYIARGLLISEAHQGLSNRQICITFTSPDGTAITITKTTSIGGVFYASIRPNTIGTWSVTAQFLGEPSIGAATSPSKTFTVKPNPKYPTFFQHAYVWLSGALESSGWDGILRTFNAVHNLAYFMFNLFTYLSQQLSYWMYTYIYAGYGTV